MERTYRIEFMVSGYWELPEHGVIYSTAAEAEQACKGYSYYSRRVVSVEEDGTRRPVSFR